MGKGKAYSQEQIAKIISDYVELGSIGAVCEQNKCAYRTVLKYVKSDYGQELITKMSAKKKEIIDQTWEEYFKEHRKDWIKAVDVYMEHLLDPKVMATANARDTMTILGILNDKLARNAVSSEKESDGSGVAILPAVLPDEEEKPHE